MKTKHTALRVAAGALEDAAKSFRLNNPPAARPNLFDLHADATRAAITKAEGEA